MIRRVAVLIALCWVLGFGIFMLTLGKPLDDRTTDGIVVLTGGPGRIERGIDMLRQGKARRLLVSGVGRAVTPRQFAAQYDIEPKLMGCCVDLGHEAVDTRSNGRETARWVKAHDYKTIRLVTVDWHMPRARLELSHQLGKGVELDGDAVRVEGNTRVLTLLLEYNKYLFRSVALMIGAG